MPTASVAVGAAVAAAEPAPAAVAVEPPPAASPAYEKTIVSPPAAAPAPVPAPAPAAAPAPVPAPRPPPVFVEEKKPDLELQAEAAKTKKIKIIAAVAVVLILAGVGIFQATRVPDLSIEQARAIADKGVADFCAQEPGFVCTNFVLEELDIPSDERFLWSFPFVNKNTEPPQKITVNVSEQGESEVQFEGPFPAEVPEGG